MFAIKNELVIRQNTYQNVKQILILYLLSVKQILLFIKLKILTSIPSYKLVPWKFRFFFNPTIETEGRKLKDDKVWLDFACFRVSFKQACCVIVSKNRRKLSKTKNASSNFQVTNEIQFSIFKNSYSLFALSKSFFCLLMQ